jgi:hypothetical protein
MSHEPVSISGRDQGREILFTSKIWSLHRFSSGATTLAESLHPAEKDIYQYHFSIPQNILDHVKERFSIGESIFSQEFLTWSKRSKTDGSKSGEYGGCRALVVALHSIELNVTFAV